MSWWKFRNALQKLHLWIGLTLSIPFILIGVSGSAIILIHALPDLRMPFATASGDNQSLTRIIEAANKAAPEGQHAALVTMPQGLWQPARVQLAIRPELAPQGGRGQNLL